MKKTLASLFAGLSLVAAALVLTPSSASAALSDCGAGNFCAWTDDNYTGGLAQWWGSDNDWWGDGMHDNAESLYNNASSSTSVPDNVNVYRDPGYNSFGICVMPGESVDFWMNDNDYDSHLWVHSC